MLAFAEELELEGAGDADAVLVLGEALVGVGRGEGAPGEQVVLVGGEHEPATEDCEEQVLPLLDGVDSLFRDGRRREHEEGQALQAELYERIGRLNMEVEWLKKSVARCG